MNAPGRLVTLVLVTPDGQVLGCLSPFPVSTPWWQEVAEVVRGADQYHRIHVTVLRLLEADRPSPPGGSVTYLAEVQSKVPAERWNRKLDEHALRQSWARPGGPARDILWADNALIKRRLRRIGTAQQVRTWNLSSIWRLLVDGRTFWLKVVPSFFAHEGALLERLQDDAVPNLVAHHQQRMLLGEVPGEDMYDAACQTLLKMVTLLVHLQCKWVDKKDELLVLGLPDWRGPALTQAIHRTVQSFGGQLSNDEKTLLASFVEGIEERFAAVARCGIPDALVHGDFHPGNFRGDGQNLVLMDWGDSGVGHPLLDETAFFDRVPLADVGAVRDHWHREWRLALPGSDPAQASRLLAPIGAARQAVIYQKFLENIEPSERPYHQSDPIAWLQRTAALVRSES